MADPRNARTEAAIKDAMLRLMEHKQSALVGVAELAREAGVSRSSFYNHFSGIHEVFSALCDDFDAGNLSISGGLRCDGPAGDLTPFCVRVRNAGKLSPLVSDPGFLPELMSRAAGNRRGLGGLATDAGLPPDQAASLSTFQLAGCYAAAMALPPEADWESSRKAIDRIIASGASRIA